jgi:serine/threonine protein kinase/WD40 repeat protein
MADSHSNFRAIFDEASELAAGEPRRAFLDQACDDDAALRAEVEGLLRAQDAAGGFLADPERDAPAATAPVIEREGDRIGRYKLLQKIGEGGCGVVYMAEQTEPVRRRVALKVIKLGMDTRSVITRFEAERQALALMDHANIAKILDAGTTDSGRPYFVMELVRGIKITDYCEQHQLSTTARLQLFIQVCQAVQHAHQKGIIHRDLKPSNILVTSDDGVPLPKVIDFGIAKATADIQLTDKTLFTRFDMFIGTPAYMSPEQAEFNATDIDTRTDIYALGVLLYELLTGQTPFDGTTLLQSGLEAMRRTLRETEPVRPSTKLSQTLVAAEVTRRTEGADAASASARRRLQEQIQRLRGDLDWIVLKCLEKDRARRYETANGLAMDIGRHLANEPIVARPPGRAYRVGKLVRRNRLPFAAAAVVMLALVLAVAGVLFVQYRANQDFRQRLYVSEVNRAGLAWQAGHTELMRTLLDRCAPDLRHWEWNFLHQQSGRWEQKVLLPSTNLRAVALSADASLMVMANDGQLQVRAFPSGQWLRNLPATNPTKAPLALAPRGELLAVAEAAEGIVTIWNVRTGERVAGIAGAGWSLDWSNDGQRLAFVANETEIRLWDAKTGRHQPLFSAPAQVVALAFSPDGQTLAVGTREKDIHLLDTATGSVRRTLRTLGPYFYRLLFSPDGRKLAAANATAGGYARDHRVWNLDDEGRSLELDTGAEVSSFSFSTDSRRLVIGDAAGLIRIWDLDRRVEVERFPARRQSGTLIRLLPDERILAVSAEGICLWQAGRPGVISLTGYPDALRNVAFSPDSRWLVAAGLDAQVFVWDARDGQRAGTYTGHSWGRPIAMAVSREGRVASADQDQNVRLWTLTSVETQWETSLAPAPRPYWLAFSPDGRRLYAPSKQDTLTVLDAATGRHLNSISGLENTLDGIAVSPDGRLLALCQKVKLSIRRAEDLQEVWSAAALPERCADFSPDGQWLATGDSDNAVTLWEMASAGRVRRSLRGHAGAVSGVSFHPDGRRLVSCSFDGQVKVWDWRAGVELLTLTRPGGGQLWHAAFSPDGKMIAAAGGDGVVTLWRVE